MPCPEMEYALSALRASCKLVGWFTIGLLSHLSNYLRPANWWFILCSCERVPVHYR